MGAPGISAAFDFLSDVGHVITVVRPNTEFAFIQNIVLSISVKTRAE